MAAWISLWNGVITFPLKQTSPRSCCTACHRSYGAEFNGCFAPLRFPQLCLIIGSYTQSQQLKNSPPVEDDICIYVFCETQREVVEKSVGNSTLTERVWNSCVCVCISTHLRSPRQHTLHLLPPSLSLSPTGEIRDLNDRCLPPPLSAFLSAGGTNSTLHSPVSPRQMKP